MQYLFLTQLSGMTPLLNISLSSVKVEMTAVRKSDIITKNLQWMFVAGS
jgi:hypothetical protein